MNRLFPRHLLVFVMVFVIESLLIVGCGQATPGPVSTQALGQPSVAPAPKVAWPDKGKTITMIVGWPPGSSNDVLARMIVPYMERDFGVPVVVENKAGASTQIALTEVAKAKPDGYTIYLDAMPIGQSIYMDPERGPQAGFNRQSFQTLGMLATDPNTLIVKATSPFKTTKDLVDYAKANPEKVRQGTNGVLSVTHVGGMMLERVAGVKFAAVHFPGGSDQLTALLGDHIELGSQNLSAVFGLIKSGQLVPLGVCDTARSTNFLPDVKTFEEHGYPGLDIGATRGLTGPVGMPREIIQRYSDELKRISDEPELVKKATEAGYEVAYMDADRYSRFWDDLDAKVKPLYESFWADMKKK